MNPLHSFPVTCMCCIHLLLISSHGDVCVLIRINIIRSYGQVYYIPLANGVIVRRVLYEARSNLRCTENNEGGGYTWTLNDTSVAGHLGGIDSQTINDNTLLITSMSPVLVGIYKCSRGNSGTLNTYNVLIIGKKFCVFQ